MVINQDFVTTDAIKSLTESVADEIVILHNITLSNSRFHKQSYRNAWRSRKGVRYDRWK